MDSTNTKVINVEDYLGKLSTDLTSEEYHGLRGTYSSSQLKTMLEDPELFYKSYITKEIEKKENTNFNVGTYFHTAVLEPEKLDLECAVFTGTRSGEKWRKFQEENAGKCIITDGAELRDAEIIIKATKESPIAMNLVNNSKPEVSAFAELFIISGEIYGFRNEECFSLQPSGWVKTTGGYDEEQIKEFGFRMIVKVRADAYSEILKTISDLKSTSVNACKIFDVTAAVAEYSYDLSASFYLDIFWLVTGIEFDRFIWIFASKKYQNCKSYVASHKNILIGRAKWTKAVRLIEQYERSNWSFEDSLGEIGPTSYNLEWLN